MVHATFSCFLDCSYSNEKKSNKTVFLRSKQCLKLVSPALILGCGPAYQIHDCANSGVDVRLAYVGRERIRQYLSGLVKSGFLAGVKRRFFRCSVCCRDAARQPDIICTHCLCSHSFSLFLCSWNQLKKCTS